MYIKYGSIIITYRRFVNNTAIYVSDDYRICRIEKGLAIWNIGNKDFSIKEYQYVLVNGSDMRFFHDVYKLELTCLSFPPELIRLTHLNNFFELDNSKNRVISNSPKLNSIFDEIFRLSQLDNLNKSILMGARILDFLCEVASIYDYPVYTEKKINGKIKIALNYLDKNFNQNISLEKIAASVFLSPEVFSRMFTANMGINYSFFLMRKRISYAILLLQSTDRTVIDIAMECGYSSLANFYQCFKKITNHTPSYYRSEISIV